MILSTILSKNITKDIKETCINIFSCRSCEKQFTTKGNLNENIRIPCQRWQQCDYKATQANHLKAHIKNINKNIQIPCQQCDYPNLYENC